MSGGAGEATSPRLDEMLLEGLDSPLSEMTPADWEGIRREVLERIATRPVKRITPFPAREGGGGLRFRS
jgi:hypothetical protein